MTHQRNRSVRKRKSMRGGRVRQDPCPNCVGGRRRNNKRSMRGGWQKYGCPNCVGGRRRSNNRRSMRGGWGWGIPERACCVGGRRRSNRRSMRGGDILLPTNHFFANSLLSTLDIMR